jgi:hypothetical protein
MLLWTLNIPVELDCVFEFYLQVCCVHLYCYFIYMSLCLQSACLWTRDCWHKAKHLHSICRREKRSWIWPQEVAVVVSLIIPLRLVGLGEYPSVPYREVVIQRCIRWRWSFGSCITRRIWSWQKIDIDFQDYDLIGTTIILVYHDESLSQKRSICFAKVVTLILSRIRSWSFEQCRLIHWPSPKSAYIIMSWYFSVTDAYFLLHISMMC